MGLRTNFSFKVFHNSYRNDLSYTKSCSKFLYCIVDNAFILILKKKTICKHIFRHVHDRISRSFVFFSGFDTSSDECFCFLSICSRICYIYSGFNSVNIVICPDRSDVLLVNLVVRRGGSSITNEDSTSDFLIKHHAHLFLKESDYIEICNIDNVISVKFLFLVDSCRSCDSLKQSKYFINFLVSFDITSSSCVRFSDISKD